MESDGVGIMGTEHECIVQKREAPVQIEWAVSESGELTMTNGDKQRTGKING